MKSSMRGSRECTCRACTVDREAYCNCDLSTLLTQRSHTLTQCDTNIYCSVEILHRPVMDLMSIWQIVSYQSHSQVRRGNIPLSEKGHELMARGYPSLWRAEQAKREPGLRGRTIRLRSRVVPSLGGPSGSPGIWVTLWRRPSWVRIPPPALFTGPWD